MTTSWVARQVRCPGCPAMKLHNPADLIDGRCVDCAEAERLFLLCPTCEGDRLARSLWGYPIADEPCTRCDGRGSL